MIRIIPTRVGTSYADMVRGIYNGIIPTRVGTSVLVRWQYEATKDHPHACGDKNPL